MWIILLMFQGSLSAEDTATMPMVKNGILDLSNWDLDSNGPVLLKGNWEFYWNSLLYPGDFEAGIGLEETQFVEVPGYWTNYNIDEKVFPADGFATFRMVVKNLNADDVISLNIPTIQTAYDLYVNGLLVARCGKISTSKDEAVAKVCPQIRSFYHTKGDLELVIQASNYHNNRGGFWQSLTLGTNKTIINRFYFAIALDLFLIGSIMIMGLYHLGLFLSRKKSLSALYFGIFCLIIAARTSFHNSTFFWQLFPWFNWDLFLRFDYFTLYLPCILFSLFIRQLYPEEFNLLILKGIGALCGFYSLITIVTPASIFSNLLHSFQIIILLICLYVIYVVVLATIRKKEGAAVLMSGALILILTVFNDILYARAIIHTFFISSFGLFLFIFSQAFVISKRFSNAFRTVEVLSTNLEEKVNDQTAAIRDLLDNTGQGIFSFDSDFKIQRYASRATHDIFGKRVTGLNALELMYKDEPGPIPDYWSAIFDSGGKMKLMKGVLPKEYIFDDKVFEIDYRWIGAGKLSPQRIMLILTDVTAKRKLENMLEEDEKRNQKILRIATDRHGFLRFYNSVQEKLDHIRQILAAGDSNIDIEELCRIFHTIKGGTASYGFHMVSGTAHEIESTLQELITKKTYPNKDQVQEINQQLDQLQALFAERILEVGDLLPSQLLKASKLRYYTISDDKIDQVERLLMERYENSDELKKVFTQLKMQPVRNLMKKLSSDAKELAFQAGKQLRVDFTGETTQIVHDAYEEFFTNLIHLVRNAVDHGIEYPQERRKAGKEEEGLLKISFELENGQLNLSFSDDGKGIDVDAVKQTALKMDLIDHSQFKKIDDQKALKLIFKTGFSTKKDLTTISGRGIGMDALYSSVKEIGGDISVSSEPGVGTSFSITLPKLW